LGYDGGNEKIDAAREQQETKNPRRQAGGSDGASGTPVELFLRHVCEIEPKTKAAIAALGSATPSASVEFS
jgi:hypothetical protein